MKEKYKIIAVDIDGTLLKSDKTIHKDSIRDIQAATKNGIHVVYCTGHAISELQQYFKVLPMVRYAVCYIGAIIYDCIENKYIYQNEIEQKYIEKIITVAKKHKAMIHFLTKKNL